MREHPAARYEAQVRSFRRWAMAAIGALGLTIAQRAITAGVMLWRIHAINDAQGHLLTSHDALASADRLVAVWVGLASTLLWLTAGAFLRWLYVAVRLTRALGGETLPWKPKDAVWGFVIPFLSFVRPYYLLRDVHDVLLPDFVSEPPVQVHADDTRGYREVTVEAPPPPAKLPHGSIGAWWAAFWAGNLLHRASVFAGSSTLEALAFSDGVNGLADVVDVLSAGLAIVVVRTVTGRLVERFRRIRYTTAESLAQQGVVVA